jgi:hypothetical protein
VACGLVLSAVLGFFIDWEGQLDYNSVEGVAYALSISLSTILLTSGVVHSAIVRGQTLYVTRDVDIFVFFIKSVATGDLWPGKKTPIQVVV